MKEQRKKPEWTSIFRARFLLDVTIRHVSEFRHTDLKMNETDNNNEKTYVRIQMSRAVWLSWHSVFSLRLSFFFLHPVKKRRHGWNAANIFLRPTCRTRPPNWFDISCVKCALLGLVARSADYIQHTRVRYHPACVSVGYQSSKHLSSKQKPFKPGNPDKSKTVL